MEEFSEEVQESVVHLGRVHTKKLFSLLFHSLHMHKIMIFEDKMCEVTFRKLFQQRSHDYGTAEKPLNKGSILTK